MKKLMLVLAFTMMFQTQDTRVTNTSDDLDTMMELTEEMDLALEEWQDIYVEELTQDTFKELRHLLGKTYTLQKDTTKQMEKYTFIPKKSIVTDDLNHKIEAVIPTENKQDVNIRVIFSGGEWNETVRSNYTSMTNNLQKDYKLQLETSFACAKLNEDGIMNDDYLIRSIMVKLQAIHIDEQKDNIVDSVYERNVYGNSTLFHRVMNIGNQQINFQVAIRQTANQKRQVILGTPLILNEY